MAARGSSLPPVVNCSGSVCTICRSSVWQKSSRKFIGPAARLPLQLPPDSGALRLLQRIRDEAHRFANTYHQLLMKKRIGESILDDCPGVSQNRKNLLLRRFGSVKRLRKASVEEIAATEGIGPKLAEEVHRFLATTLNHAQILRRSEGSRID